MGKVATDGVIDGGLDAARLATRMTVQPSEPASIGDITANALATDSGRIPGDYPKANGDVSGRKITAAAGTDLSITSSGTGNHIAHDDGVNFWVTTCTPQALTAGGTVTVPAHDYEIADPV